MSVKSEIDIIIFSIKFCKLRSLDKTSNCCKNLSYQRYVAFVQNFFTVHETNEGIIHVNIRA